MISETMSGFPDIDAFLNLQTKEKVKYDPENLSPELLQVAEKIGEYTGTWNPVEIFTPNPDSLADEKIKFLTSYDKGDDYIPSFDYDVAQEMDVSEVRSKLAIILKYIRNLTPKNEQERLFRVALYAKVRDDLATCDLVDGIKSKDEEQIRSGMARKYPEPDPSLVLYAEQAYRELTSLKNEKQSSNEAPLLDLQQQELLKKSNFNAEQIKEAFEWVLQKYNILKDETHLQGFNVLISDRATGIDVRDKSEEPMTIFIPSSRNVTGDKLLELIAHEIEGHARQSMNGLEMFKLGGGPLKMDGEVLYEGLAKRLDESFRTRFFGDNTGIPDPCYTLAIQKAIEGASFSDIFKDQYERELRVLLKVSPDKELVIDNEKNGGEIEKAKNYAWGTTYRVMRGHTDMSNPLGFAMCKDLAYLQGWLMDKELREAGHNGINEMAVIQSGGLQLIARLGVEYSDIPHPYEDFTKEYCFSVLLPNLIDLATTE